MARGIVTLLEERNTLIVVLAPDVVGDPVLVEIVHQQVIPVMAAVGIIKQYIIVTGVVIV